MITEKQFEEFIEKLKEEFCLKPLVGIKAGCNNCSMCVPINNLSKDIHSPHDKSLKSAGISKPFEDTRKGCGKRIGIIENYEGSGEGDYMYCGEGDLCPDCSEKEVEE